MTELLGSIQNLIILYAPTILTAAGVVANLFTNLKQIKKITVKDDVKKGLEDVTAKVEELKKSNAEVAERKDLEISTLVAENAKLRAKLNKLISLLGKVEVKDDEVGKDEKIKKDI